MGYESNTGLGTLSRYGVSGTQKGVASGGHVRKAGVERELVIYIDGEDFNGATSFDTQYTLPVGAVVTGAICEVTDAFTLGNADNDIYVGTNGSEGTNYGMQILNPAAATVTTDAPGGTWASPITTAVTVGVLVSGTTAAASAGKAKVVIKYDKI